MELPQYTVYVETPRLLLPKTFKLILIGTLFYIIIWTNFFLLKKNLSFLSSILIMLGIIILILASTIQNYTKLSNYQYRFYSNRIEYYGKVQQVIMYNQIKQLQIEKNFLDKLFGTGILNLGIFKIKYVPNLNQVFFYVQKMVQMISYQNNNQYQQQYSPQYPQYNNRQYYSQLQNQQNYSQNQNYR